MGRVVVEERRPRAVSVTASFSNRIAIGNPLNQNRQIGNRRSAIAGDGRYNPPRSNVALAPGARLGPYEVIAKLGEGGMGEVYRSRDTRLNRDVAIKVLPALFASDPERLARFQREAQLLASLNHAHIAQVYGVEETPENGSRAIVMELAVVVNWFSDWQQLGSGAPSARH